METASAEEDNGAVDLEARWAGQEEGVGKVVYIRSLCIMNHFLHIRTVCSYIMYVVTYMCIRGGTNIQHIQYI